VDLNDIYRTPHPIKIEYSLFSRAFTKTDHILGCKTSFKSYSDQMKSKQEISNRQISGKHPTIQKSYNIFLNNPWIKEEIRGEIILNWVKIKIKSIRLWGMSLRQYLGGIYKTKCLYIRTKEMFQTNDLNFYFKKI
jgi:hypothetical protein